MLRVNLTTFFQSGVFSARKNFQLGKNRQKTVIFMNPSFTKVCEDEQFCNIVSRLCEFQWFEFFFKFVLRTFAIWVCFSFWSIFKFGSQISRKEYCSSTVLIVLHQNHGFLSPTKTENSASLVKKKHSLHLHISKF